MMNEPIILREYTAGPVPLISVLLPVYNGGNYLKESVQSVLTQDYSLFEFLVIDDCSTDGSLEYLEAIPDLRFRLWKNATNRGLFFNLNFLIGKSAAPLLKLWAQDDIMYPVCLSHFVEFNNAHPGLGFSYSARDIIDESGHIKEIKKQDHTPAIISPALHARIAYYTGSIAGNIANTCINKYALERVGLFNENMQISADFDMWVRLAKDHDTGFIREKIIKLRDHSEQLSRKGDLYINHVREDIIVYNNLDSYVTPKIKKEGRLLLRKYKFVFYYTLMCKSILRGHIRGAYEYFKILASQDNFFLLTVAFIKVKLGGKKQSQDPQFIKP